MKPEKKQKVFLALTSIHRKINNDDHKIKWTKEFNNQGINDPLFLSKTRKALSDMGVIKIQDNKTYWSKQRTAPSPVLVEGILKYIGEHKEEFHRRKQCKPITTKPDVKCTNKVHVSGYDGWYPSITVTF